jgi:formylglycine-generating enzyme required for sulfatase activity
MGSWRRDEKPQHDVTVNCFYIGKYQITQAQWEAVMGNNPSHFKGVSALPVECVSWNDAKQFCKKLSKITSKAYRLPSEAEWEYACRAGTTGDYGGDLDAMAWYGNNSGLKDIDANALWRELRQNVSEYIKRLKENGNKTRSVGGKRPNTFGLHDMHGNVWEWCEDVWHDNYSGAPADGSVWSSGGDPSFRVVRGGSWLINGGSCRSAYRGRSEPGFHDIDLGVRVVVSAATLTP